MGTRGIYCVAFGEPARACARDLLASVKQHIPKTPFAFVGSEKLGGEDVFIEQPDSDVGGREAKLKAYELAPKEWEHVLYLDADTEIISKDVLFFFDLLSDGWEFVICKDPNERDTMHAFRRSNAGQEMIELEAQLCTLHILQYNGGVWAFRRGERVRKFFDLWLSEWRIHRQRDQGALVRAMYKNPLKVYLLGNQWNTFENYSVGIEAAALRHFPGKARRWKGLIPGRLDSGLAWNAVEKYEKTRRK